MSAKIRFVKKWEKPPTAVYEDNYGYGINYYQPMIDYINAKEKGLTPAVPPHIPWNNERGLAAYRPGISVRSYSEEDLHRLSQDASDRAKRDLNQFKIAKRSDFSVRKMASAANVTKHVQTESVSTKTKKKMIQRNIEDSQESRRKMEELQTDLSRQKQVSVHTALSATAKVLRGKSAKAIEATLLSESMRNISNNSDVDIKGLHSNQQITLHSGRNHSQIMDTRIQQQLNESFMVPLDGLRHDLRSFDHKSSHFFMDKRLLDYDFYGSHSIEQN